MSAITGKLQTAVSELPSGYFAMVMATGIVSIASHLLGMGTVARVLFRMNLVFVFSEECLRSTHGHKYISSRMKGS